MTISPALLSIFEETATKKAVMFPDGRYIAYWDHFGKCRVISCDEVNRHFGVPHCDGIDKTFAIPFTKGE